MEPVAGLHKSLWTARLKVNLPSVVHGCCQRDGKIPLFQARATANIVEKTIATGARKYCH